MINAYLAEEHMFRTECDEDLSVDPPYSENDSWAADPMDILMAKQERERNDLAFLLDSLVH